MPKRSVNDLSDLGTSRRCRQLAVNIRRTKGEGLERVFDTMIGSIGRAEFWKLLDTEARWPRVYVNLFASHASSAMGWKRQEVLRHLVEPPISTNARLTELTRATLLRENRASLAALFPKMADYIGSARKIISIHRVLPVGFITEGVLAGTIARQQKIHSFGAEDAESKRRYGLGMRNDYINRYDPGRTRISIGMLQSAYEDLLLCTGTYGDVTREDAYECFESLREDSVIDRNIDLKLVDDGMQLPHQFKEWLTGLDGIVAIDDRFLMKISDDGRFRSFMERGVDAQIDSFLDSQLTMLDQMLARVSCGQTRQELVDALNPEHVNLGAAMARIREDNLGEMRDEG